MAFAKDWLLSRVVTNAFCALLSLFRRDNNVIVDVVLPASTTQSAACLMEAGDTHMPGLFEQKEKRKNKKKLSMLTLYDTPPILTHSGHVTSVFEDKNVSEDDGGRNKRCV